jgi:hypothetical protein
VGDIGANQFFPWICIVSKDEKDCLYRHMDTVYTDMWILFIHTLTCNAYNLKSTTLLNLVWIIFYSINKYVCKGSTKEEIK